MKFWEWNKLKDKKTNQKNKGQNVKQQKKKKKKMKLWKKILIVIILILLIAGGWFIYRTQKNGGGISGMLATVVGHDENTKKSLGEFKILLLGISTDQTGVDLTDTIIVASYNPNTQKATLLSIPRDTYTGKTPSRATAYEKINSLYSRKHRPDETLEAINQITGLGIEYYAVIKTEALIELVDAIGGVTFNVPIDMYYNDETQDLHIDLKKGEQLLDGDKAEQLVRFRHNDDGSSYPEEYGDNDTGRMRTQREFIMATIKQTAKPENIFKLGQILEIAEKNIITNIDFNVAKDYIPYIVEFSTENMLTETLPGENKYVQATNTWMFFYDKEETKNLIQELFYDRDIQEETTTENGEVVEGNTNNVSKADIKLEVLNGSGNSKKLQEAVNEAVSKTQEKKNQLTSASLPSGFGF